VALAEIAAAGHDTRKIRLIERQVGPCLAHPNCRDGQACRVRDDFPALAEAVHEADAVLFAVPVYYWGVPSHFKAFIDRHVHYYGLRKYAARAIGVILVAAEDGIEETELQMRNFLETGGHAGIPWSEVLVLQAYAYARGEARSSAELMSQAAELGRSIVARLGGPG
jgi:multimeric flavodoxin WrbA